MATRNSKKRRSLPKLSAPSLKNLPTPNLQKLPSPKDLMPNGDVLEWLEGKAKTMGDTGYRVAELSSEAQKVKKSVTK
jgi:hypothetical protein